MRLAASILALSLLIPVTTFSQYLESVIQLPDTLGPLLGPYHLAWDSDPSHPRLYVGGEGGDVLVLHALSLARLGRIATGPVSGICMNPRRGKLYSTDSVASRIVVVDCATNQITGFIPTVTPPARITYNQVNDRVYCGSASYAFTYVVDCAGDTLMHTVPMDGRPTCFAFDSLANDLFIGTNEPLLKLDCDSDTVVASFPDVRAASVLCFNPTSRKVYAIAYGGLFEDVYIVNADSDSMVGRAGRPRIQRTLACDPVANRVYFVWWQNGGMGHVEAIDGAGDTLAGSVDLLTQLKQVAVNSVTGHILTLKGNGSTKSTVYVVDWELRQVLKNFRVWTGMGALHAVAALGRVYSAPPLAWTMQALDGVTEDTAALVVLAVDAHTVCYNARHNKLYYANHQDHGPIGVVDCNANRAIVSMPTRWFPSCLSFSETSDKLYSGEGWEDDLGVAVYDGAGDSAIGFVSTRDFTADLVWEPVLNKLYIATGDSCEIVVVDCVSDSVVRRLPMPGEVIRLCLAPEVHRLFCFWDLEGVSGYSVVDCARDSVVVDTVTGWADYRAVCSAPEEGKVYWSVPGVLYAINAEHPTQVRAMQPNAPGAVSASLVYVPRNHKVYWALDDGSGLHPDTVYAIDARSDSILGSVAAGWVTSEMCVDGTGDFVYYTAFDDTLRVIDARGDTLVASVAAPFGCRTPLLNRAKGCLYVGSYWSALPVYRDSIGVGLEDATADVRQSSIGPTVARSNVPLSNPTYAALYDASGRRTVVLHLGPNDISHLPSGVYFRRAADGRTSKMLIVR